MKTFVETIGIKKATWIIFTLWLPLFYFGLALYYCYGNKANLALARSLGITSPMWDIKTIIWQTVAILALSVFTVFFGMRHLAIKGKDQHLSGGDFAMLGLLVACYFLGTAGIVLLPY
jgi:hypothetical protein